MQGCGLDWQTARCALFFPGNDPVTIDQQDIQTFIWIPNQSRPGDAGLIFRKTKFFHVHFSYE